MNVYEIKTELDKKKEEKNQIDRDIIELSEQMRNKCSHPKEVVSRFIKSNEDECEPLAVSHRWTHCICNLCGEDWSEDVREV